MDPVKTLHEALKYEVSLHGDDILCETSLLEKLREDIPDSVIRIDTIDGLLKCIKNDFASIIHENYSYDLKLTRLFKDFGKEYNIDEINILRIGDAFAYALELIDDVSKNNVIPMVIKRKKPARRRLSAKEIERKIELNPIVGASLYLCFKFVEYKNDQLLISAEIIGHFTQGFKGGVFCVSYYNKNGDEIESWHNVTEYTIPYSKESSFVDGKITMYLDPIYDTDEVHSIKIEFKNSKDYELKYINTTWYNNQE